jgi:hypothetical protein
MSENEVDNHALLIEARELTRITGCLNDLQIQQLKFWPKIISENVVGCETRFNYEDRELIYSMEIKTKNQREIDKIKKMLPQLEEWSRFLLGDEYLVRVKFNGKMAYRGTRKQEFHSKGVTNKEIEKDFVSHVKREYRQVMNAKRGNSDGWDD